MSTTISGRPSDPTTLHPGEGARFLFERTSQSDDLSEAQYRAAIYTAAERFEYSVHMRIDGWFESAVQGTPAPAELASKLDTIAKLIARGAKGKHGDSLPPWPHRVMRWRGPGRG